MIIFSIISVYIYKYFYPDINQIKELMSIMLLITGIQALIIEK